MKAGVELTVDSGGGPRVELLDASRARLDPEGLRDWARTRAAAGCGGEHVARAYRYPLALVGWHTDRLGLDVERVDPYDQPFAESICTPWERSVLLPVCAEGLASLWCSKEALSKALGDAIGYDPRRLPSPLCWPGGESGTWRAVAIEAPAGYVAWACWRSAS